jgi:hypothetical protein
MSGPTLNAQHARALTFLALDIRSATIGARAWDEHGTFVCIMKREGQNLALVAQDVIRHAARIDAQTPGVIAGSFNPPPVEAVVTKRGNPKRGEDCPKHAGQWPDNCGGCKLGELPGYGDADREPLPHQPAHADASLARAFMAQSKPNLCGCGVRRDLCPAHREAAVAEEEA